jgi:putative hemolysin
MLPLAGAALAVAGALLATSGGSASAARAADPSAAYCRSTGGTVQVRYPAFGTNDVSPLRLAGTVRFCRFESAQDGSRIFVSLGTLFATRPSLAALAYLTAPEVGEIPPGPNPASTYCARLGGTEQFGAPGAAGGGWVSDRDEVDPVLQVCVFADGSMIDAWGLTYHSWGTVRGKDLTRVLRYRPASPPELWW